MLMTLTAAERGEPEARAEAYRAWRRSLAKGQQENRAVKHCDAAGKLVRLECVHCGRRWDLRGVRGRRVGWMVAAATNHVTACMSDRYSRETGAPRPC